MAKRRLVSLLISLALLAALVLLRVADPYPLQALRQIAFDTFQRIAPREAGDYPVRVVDIDERTLAEFGQWPWPRDRLALLSDRLAELGAATIALDMLLAEPDRLSPHALAEAFGLDGSALPDTDAALAAAIARAPVVLGFADSPGTDALPGTPKSGFAVSGTDPRTAVPTLRGAVAPLPILAQAATGLGSLSLETGAEAAVLRRLPLIWTDGEHYFPSLALESLRVAMRMPTLVILGETGAPFVEAVRVGGFTIPTTPSGGLWLYYREEDPGLYVSAADVLGPDYGALRDRIDGQIVLVGTSASGLLDIHTTALGDNVPGVSVHAQAIEQILGSRYLTRTDWVSGLEILAFALVGVILISTILTLGPLAGGLVGLGALALAVGLSWFSFRNWGLMIDPSFLVIGLAVLHAVLTFLRFVISDADRRTIRRAFAHYVSPAVMSEIERNAENLTLGGQEREITVMFSDMRNFTGFSEARAPEDILRMLNTMFGALGSCIVEQQGTIDKFVGDAIMAFWNAPLDLADHPRRACLAALAMRGTLAELNRTGAIGTHGAPVAIGVGIATGNAVVGNMGLPSRFDYSALGDTVNMASRVEGACKVVGYDLLVTGAVRDAVPDFAMLSAGALTLRGKSARVPIYAIVGDAGLAATPEFGSLAVAHARAVSLFGSSEADAAIADCRARAAAIEPGLGDFYARLAERAEDYETPTPRPA